MTKQKVGDSFSVGDKVYVPRRKWGGHKTIHEGIIEQKDANMATVRIGSRVETLGYDRLTHVRPRVVNELVAPTNAVAPTTVAMDVVAAPSSLDPDMRAWLGMGSALAPNLRSKAQAKREHAKQLELEAAILDRQADSIENLDRLCGMAAETKASPASVDRETQLAP